MAFMLVVFGMTGIIGSLAGGIVFDTFGGSALYYIMAVFALMGSIGLGSIGLIFFHLKEKTVVKGISI
ncbi:hypothetical protein ACA29_15160 [Lederbergia galactosidilytica]|uniref:Uncharacterized protein n=1 Tax=Lederbergia galactosidilytica TaxID=217031 RepID=A0A0Q9XTU4_9BACI|nr:hypothetical protein ACA29_15160 [Lederbergia galactosidilytica]